MRGMRSASGRIGSGRCKLARVGVAIGARGVPTLAHRAQGIHPTAAHHGNGVGRGRPPPKVEATQAISASHRLGSPVGAVGLAARAVPAPAGRSHGNQA